MRCFIGSIGRINTLFSLFHQEKKEIHDAVQPWGIRNLTDFRRHAQNCSFPPVNSTKFLPSGMPTTCRFFRRFNDRYVPEGAPCHWKLEACLAETEFRAELVNYY
jgi:hypothetical protein